MKKIRNVTIHKFTNNTVCISSRDNFFKDEVCTKFFYDKIEVTKPDIDTIKINKTHFHKRGRWQFIVNIINVDVDIPLGKFYFDEDDSNVDKIVIYFN